MRIIRKRFPGNLLEDRSFLEENTCFSSGFFIERPKTPYVFASWAGKCYSVFDIETGIAQSREGFTIDL